MASGISRHSSMFFPGIGGGVYMGAVPLGFLKEWSIEVSCEVYGAPTFRSPVAHGLAWDVKRFVGLAEAKVELTGYATQNSQDLMAPGTMISLTLLISEDSSVGLSIPSAVIQSISFSQDATGTSPVEFKASVEVNGPIEMLEG